MAGRTQGSQNAAYFTERLVLETNLKTLELGVASFISVLKYIFTTMPISSRHIRGAVSCQGQEAFLCNWQHRSLYPGPWLSLIVCMRTVFREEPVGSRAL